MSNSASLRAKRTPFGFVPLLVLLLLGLLRPTDAGAFYAPPEDDEYPDDPDPEPEEDEDPPVEDDDPPVEDDDPPVEEDAPSLEDDEPSLEDDEEPPSEGGEEDEGDSAVEAGSEPEFDEDPEDPAADAGDLDEGEDVVEADEGEFDPDAPIDFVEDDAYYDPFAEEERLGEDVEGDDGDADWWDEDSDEGDPDEVDYDDPYAYEGEGEGADLEALIDGELSDDDLEDLTDEELELLAELRELDEEVGADLPEEDRIEPNAAMKLFRQGLVETCPDKDPDTLEACLRGDAVQERVAGMPRAAVAQWLLGAMDVELPVALGKTRIEGLAQRCDAEGEAWSRWVGSRLGEQAQECAAEADWADCAVDGALSDWDEKGRYESFAQCVVEDHVVTTAYVSIQRKKKKAFHPKVYLHYRGLMAGRTVEQLKGLRKQCGARDASVDSLRKCFQRHPEVARELNDLAAYSELVSSEIDSGGDPKAAKRFKARFSKLFLTLPELSVEVLAKGCDTSADGPQTLDEAEQVLACIEEKARQNPLANPAYISPERLGEWYPKIRKTVLDRLRAKEEATLARVFGYIWRLLGVVALLGGLAIALMPLGLRKRYPNVDPKSMWRSSAIASATFVVTMGLLGITLSITKTVQGGIMMDNTSPKLVVANGLFDVLEEEENRQRFSDMSAAHLDLVRTPLQNVLDEVKANEQGAREAANKLAQADLQRYEAFAAYMSEEWVKLLREPEIELFIAHLTASKAELAGSKIVVNAQRLKERVDAYQSVFALFRKVDWVMGYLPIVMSLLAVVLYMLPLRETLTSIALAPARSAQGGDGEAIVARAKKTITAEMKVLLPYLGIAFVVIVVTGFFLALAIKPFIELLMNYTLMTVFYILLGDASAGVLEATLGGAMVLLAGCLVVYLLAAISFLGTTQKILRARFHHGLRLRDVSGLWGKAALAVGWILLVPWLYSLVVLNVMTQGVGQPTIPTAADMLLIPIVATILLPTVLWAVRALKALGFVRKLPALAAQRVAPSAGPGA